jgi:phosphopantetheinyl transferase
VEGQKDTFLHPDEILLNEKHLVEARQYSFLLGRLCAKEALVGLIGRDSRTSIAVLPGVFQQPVVRATHGINACVSISHTNRIAAALAFDEAHPMGVDIEVVTQEQAATIETKLTHREKRLIAHYRRKPHELFFVIWTMKEALAKVLRTGLMTDPSILEITELFAEKESWRGIFGNFAQYGAHAFALRDHIFAFALPRRTNFQWLAAASEEVAQTARS